MPEDRPTAIVRIKEAHHRDAGRDIARLDSEMMEKLGIETKIGIETNDCIEIVGKAKAYAIALQGDSDDMGKGIIRIDGATRANAGVGIDDKVRISRVSAQKADSITLSPIQEIKLVRVERTIARMLEGRPVVIGERVRVDMLPNPLEFTVTSTKPAGRPVIVKYDTQIVIRDRIVSGTGRAIPIVNYEDIGGLGREIGLVREMVELPLRRPELFERLGIEPPKGILLHGPPGTGKTLIAQAVASATESNFISISGPEIVSKFYGESEKQLREIFEEAERNAPSIIFIDEVDSIAPKRSEVTGELERRIVAQLLSAMDGLKGRGSVVVLAATNRPNAIDEALRRGGRFDREIEIGVPDRNGRLQILQVHTRSMPLDDKKWLCEIADSTHGYVGADISALCKEAAMHSLRKILPLINIEAQEIPPEIIETLTVTKDDFASAMKNIEPSAMREVHVEIPDVRWNDVGGLKQQKQQLMEAIIWPLKYADAFSAIKIKPPSGMLLFGPPGTGKTMLAKAIANESAVNFISIKGPELLSKYVGESERAVRDTFRKARQASPSIVFFDEIDSLAPARGGAESPVAERVVSQILTEIDGLEELSDVTILAATNRPDMVDPALLRPGRFDRLVYIPPPAVEDRAEIFKIHLKDMPVEAEDIAELAKLCENFTGADIESVCREAGMHALHDFIKPGMTPEEVKEQAPDIRIRRSHFIDAIGNMRLTISPEELQMYEMFNRKLATTFKGLEDDRDKTNQK